MLKLSKDKRQALIEKEYRETLRSGMSGGTLEAVTGFGKTRVATNIMRAYQNRNPLSKIIVIVPGIDLKDQWEGILKKLKINAEVQVINSAVKKPRKCGLLICDEVHHYSGEKAKVFNSVFRVIHYEYILCLTATVDERIQSILDKHAPVFHTVSLEDARANDYISKYIIYNVGLELSSVEEFRYRLINENFNKHFNKFNRNFELMMNVYNGRRVYCSSIPATVDDKYIVPRKSDGALLRTDKKGNSYYLERTSLLYAESLGRDEKEVKVAAINAAKAMHERKSFLYNADCKVEAAKEIIDLFPKSRYLVFTETTELADNIASVLGIPSYHSNVQGHVIDSKGNIIAQTITNSKGRKKYKDVASKRILDYNKLKALYPTKKLKRVSGEVVKAKNLKDFIDKKTPGISTAKALDEGFDDDSISLGLLAASKSITRQTIQRIGRIVRYVPGKQAVIVNLYIKGTQEEKWTKKRTPVGSIWIDLPTFTSLFST